MRAWQYTGPNQPLQLNDVAAPSVQPSGVVIDVKASGICHIDVGILDGSLADLVPFTSFTLGHEIAGVITEIGGGVEGLTLGQRVAVPVSDSGPGTVMDGGFAEQVATPAEFVVPIPDSVTFEQAAAATDAGLTSYHAVKTQGNVRSGMRVGIIGLGGLGSLGAQIALALGADLYIAEINENVHDYAHSLGATKVAKSIEEFADDDLEVIVDFAGFGTTTAGAIQVVSSGGRIVQVGLGKQEATLDLYRVTFEEIQLVGATIGTREEFHEVLGLIEAGQLTARTSEISFEEIADGIAQLEEGRVTGRLVAVQ